MLAGLVAPFDVGRMVLRTTRSIFDVRRIRQGRTAKAALPLTAPRTSINVAVHARRRVAFAAASLADVKTLKNAMGTTVNDVVLAMCAGALRTYLLAGDELPDIPLVSVVPVSVTPDVAELKGSNKMSAMFVQLPCAASTIRSSASGSSTRAPRGPRRSTRRSAPRRCRTGPSTRRPTSSPRRPASTPG